MKIADLRAKSKEELNELVTGLKKERFALRMQEATGALENRARFRETRLTIARAMTVMNEKITPGAAKTEKAAPKKAARKIKKEKE